MSETVVQTIINPEIIVNIMRMLAKDGSNDCTSALSAISQTCKFLHFEGVRLLSSGVLVNRRIPSFCLFMLSYRTIRPPLLRHMLVDASKLTEDTIELFSEVLHCAINLTDLIIHALDHPGPSSSFQATLCSLFASLVSVRRLTLSSIQSLRTVESLLGDLRAPLSSIFLRLPLQGELNTTSPIMYTRRRDPIFLLSGFRSTLEVVRIQGPTTFGFYTCLYPLVKELRIPNYVFCMPIIKPIMTPFPQLQMLYIGPADDSYIRDPHEAELLNEVFLGKRSIKQCHDINKQDQLMHGTWPMLKLFKATIIAAYALGVTSPVERMQLLSTGGKREHELIMLLAILSDTKPRSLRLALRAFNARGVIPFFPSSKTWSTRLESLELRMNIAQEIFNYEEFFVSRALVHFALIR